LIGTKQLIHTVVSLTDSVRLVQYVTIILYPVLQSVLDSRRAMLAVNWMVLHSEWSWSYR